MKPFSTIAIVGVGLIGGAVGLGLLKRRMAKVVIGIGHRPSSLRAAKRIGAVTDTTVNLAKGVAEADLVVVCTPVDAIARHVREAAAACRPGALITDAGSTKAGIVAEVERAQNDSAWGKDVRFVGSHPLAGNERRGPQPKTGDLFVDRVVIVTPTPRTTAADRKTVRRLWNGLGAKVVEMSPDEHDRVVAATSHMPHVVAAAIAASTPNEYVTLTAGGWLDATRIAAGDPALWRAILLGNRENVLGALDAFETRLTALRTALQQGDAAILEKLLTQAKQIRDAVGS